MSSLSSVLGSYLVDGAALAAVAACLYAFLYREVRVRPGAWWSGEKAIGSFFAPLIASLGALSVAFLFFGARGWSERPPRAGELATAAALLLGAVAVVWILRRRPGAPTGEPVPDEPLAEGDGRVHVDRAA